MFVAVFARVQILSYHHYDSKDSVESVARNANSRARYSSNTKFTSVRMPSIPVEQDRETWMPSWEIAIRNLPFFTEAAQKGDRNTVFN